MARLVLIDGATQDDRARRRTDVSPNLQPSSFFKKHLVETPSLPENRFPDILYFRQPHVQHALTTILFLHCIEHSDIGYRQGMHELLAPIYYAVDHDSLDSNSNTTNSGPSSNDAHDFCDRTWVAADSWCLFGFIMRNAREWYEWREPTRHGNTNNNNGPVPNEAYVPPIVRICNNIQSDYLRPVDPALWARLQEVGIEPQIYGM